MSTLYLVMGCPGSGKTTWIKNHLDDKSLWVSRDEIRFSMVKENEEYFSKEKEVFNEFVRRIDEGLDLNFNVIADATHINVKSRRKLLDSIAFPLNTKVCIIWIKTPLIECIKRNDNRKNTRSFVPRGVIRRMYSQIEEPNFEEGFDTIYIVEDGKPLQEIKEKK